MNIMWWRNNEGMLRMLYVLFLGQVVSFIMALASFTSSLVTNLGEAMNIMWWRNNEGMLRMLYVLFLGQVVSFIMALSSFTSSLVANLGSMVLTWFIMATRYALWQLFGAAICVTGLCLVLLSDAGVGGGGSSKPLLGDLLVIAATLSYAISNVGE
ncbi:unnamed protein product [Camellia sinensis]